LQQRHTSLSVSFYVDGSVVVGLAQAALDLSQWFAKATDAKEVGVENPAEETCRCLCGKNFFYPKRAVKLFTAGSQRGSESKWAGGALRYLR